MLKPFSMFSGLKDEKRRIRYALRKAQQDSEEKSNDSL